MFFAVDTERGCPIMYARPQFGIRPARRRLYVLTILCSWPWKSSPERRVPIPMLRRTNFQKHLILGSVHINCTHISPRQSPDTFYYSIICLISIFSISHISECLHAINPQSLHVSLCVLKCLIRSQVSYSVIGLGLAAIEWGSVHVYSLSGVLVTLYIYIHISISICIYSHHDPLISMAKCGQRGWL